MNQKDYILMLMVNSYNKQFKTRFKASDFDLFSITPRVKYRFGYEAYTKRTDDHLRLRAYFTFGDYEYTTNYRLESDGSYGVGTLDDEVLVCTGTLDRYMYEYGIIKFTFIPPPVVPVPEQILLLEDGQPMLMEDGSNILLEAA